MKLKSFCSVASIALTFYLCFPNSMLAHNLIVNPGFEVSSAMPENWTITGPLNSMQPKTSVDNQIRFEGKHSIRVESNNPNGHGRAVQSVKITGNQTYLFSARFKAEDVKSINKSVLVRIKWFKDDENIGYNYIYEIAAETDQRKLFWLVGQFPQCKVCCSHICLFTI